MTPQEFPKLFAAAFATKDKAALQAMLTSDAQVVTLTGAVVDDAVQAARAFDREFAGIFASTKLVTGRTRLRDLGPGLVLLHQRYIVTGAKDAAGGDVARFGAALTAVLLQTAQRGWLAVSLTLSSLA